MAIVLDLPVVKLARANPVAENDNVDESSREVKAGPLDLLFVSGGPADHVGLVEGIEDTTGAPGGDDRTLPHRILAAKPWSKFTPFDPVEEVVSAEAGDNDEVAPTCLLVSGGKLYFLAHVGNNSGPRESVAYKSLDGFTLTQFDRLAGKILEVGSAGQWDDLQASDPFARVLSDGSLVGLYKGRGDAGSAHDVGRFTADLDLTNVVKDAGNPVISRGGVGAWNEGSVHGAAFFEDGAGRLHAWVAGEDSGGVTSFGYYYSDDKGVTWVEGANNPVALTGTSAANDPDFSSIGDYMSVLPYGPVAIVNYGLSNLDVAWPGNPLRGRGAGVVPIESENPAIPARFIGPDTGAAWSGIPASPADLRNDTTWAIMAEFEAYPVGDFCVIFTIGPDASVFESFKHELFFRINNVGEGEAWFRTPTGFIANNGIRTSIKVDDGVRTRLMFVRNASNDFELWMSRPDVNGGAWSLEDSDATECGTADVLDYPFIGNYDENVDQDIGLASSPGRMTLKQLIVTDDAVTAAQAGTLLDGGSPPAGVTVLVDLEQGTGLGTERGEVTTVDLTPPVPQALGRGAHGAATHLAPAASAGMTSRMT
ncbi:MAG: hypothetical protein GWN84_20630 [Gammaproteobacteria bacterium]|nr:hypothetical protein [Gammaproteobacteria bacterium]NIR85168.1 hypothetical protein [Gammaproteobacteria bacterium]NIU06217.1 hypothetical protein [Gammaproteobacteria bacterium]NIX87490.1 hypothetical protein [Gammaproteobacteria bacterium]